MNDGRKLTQWIDLKNVKSLVEAANASLHMHHPLNLFVTVNCERAKVADDVHSFLSRYLKILPDWVRLRDIPWACIWVLENPPGAGLHWHAIIHLPIKHLKAFQNARQRHLRLAGAKRQARVFRSKLVGPKYSVNNLAHLHALRGLMRYLLKRADPATCEEFWIDCHNQGHVMGKRVGFSQSLGPSARNKSDAYRPTCSHYYVYGERKNYSRRPRDLLDLEGIRPFKQEDPWT
jgi:hypothetical protein